MATSQKGLFDEMPHRHRVTRLRVSYVTPSADSIGIPPRTHRGPSYPLSGSSTTAIESSSLGSIGLPFLCWMPSGGPPELQFATSSRPIRRTSGSSECKIRSRIPPARRHMPTCEQRSRTAVRTSLGPYSSSARALYDTRLVVSVPLKCAASWVLSQKGLSLDCPQRHREYLPVEENAYSRDNRTGSPRRRYLL